MNPASGSFDWTALDAQLAFADSQNEQLNIQISPIGGPKGSRMPSWVFANDVPNATDGSFTYSYYLLLGRRVQGLLQRHGPSTGHFCFRRERRTSQRISLQLGRDGGTLRREIAFDPGEPVAGASTGRALFACSCPTC